MDFKKSGILKYERGFDWVAKKKEYNANIKPGRYLLLKGMSNSQIVDVLRSGKQAEVKLVFNTTRYFDRLAGVVSKQIEADSSSIIAALRDTAMIKKYGFTTDHWRAMFIPNTYRFLWNTSAEQFLDRMNLEFKAFWNKDRENRLKEIGLDKFQLMSLAAIVQEETIKPEDMPKVAGVYMNRLKMGIKLQADPTVIYGMGVQFDGNIRKKDLMADTPYNTYTRDGLPPTPIAMPGIASIEAALHPAKTKALYFVGKGDGSHAFSNNLDDHNRAVVHYQLGNKH